MILYAGMSDRSGLDIFLQESVMMNMFQRESSARQRRQIPMRPALLIIALSACVASSSAQVRNEYLNIIPADGDEGDFFGTRSALYSHFALFSAPSDDDLGSDSGSVYLYDLSIDAPNGAMIRKIHAPDGAAADNFGGSIFMDSAMVGVGSNASTIVGPLAGSVYLFNRVSGTLYAKLNPLDAQPHDLFGSSIAKEGGTVVVGAHGDDDNGNGSGSAYLFDVEQAFPSQTHKLLAMDGQALDLFGQSVDINGGIVVVGAPNDDHPPFENGGSVYLFNASTGQQLRKIVPADNEAFDHFGSAVAIDNGIVAVCAPGDDDNGSLSGSVYLFDASTGAQLHKLVAQDSGVNKLFGSSVAIQDNKVVIGSSLNDDNGSSSGSAYIFQASSGIQLSKLLPSNGAAFEQFGHSVAIFDDTILVGAWEDTVNGQLSGSAYAFDIYCQADINGDGSLNFLDVSAFLAAFGSQNPIADFNGDSSFNFLDVSAFLAAYAAGCP